MAVPYNRLMDIVIEDGMIDFIFVDDGHLIGSGVQGEPLPPVITTLQSSEYGTFDECPACWEVINSKGVIRGIVTLNGALYAIIASWGDLPGAAAISTFDAFNPDVWIGEDIQPTKEPNVILDGDTYPWVGNAVIGSGEHLNVLGSNFSGDSGTCSRVEFYLNDELLGSVMPDSSGGFFEKVLIDKPHGRYWFEARPVCGSDVFWDGSWIMVVIEEGWWDFETINFPLILHP